VAAGRDAEGAADGAADGQDDEEDENAYALQGIFYRSLIRIEIQRATGGQCSKASCSIGNSYWAAVRP